MDKKVFKIRFGRPTSALLYTLSAVFSAVLFYNVYRLVAVSLPANERVAENIVFLVLNVLIIALALSTALLARYVFFDGRLKIYGTGLFFGPHIDAAEVYAVLDYRDANETFLLYTRKGVKKTHLLCLPRESADELCSLIMRANPQISYEIIRKEDAQ